MENESVVSEEKIARLLSGKQMKKFAGIDGVLVGHGTKRFCSMSEPQSIRQDIRSISKAVVALCLGTDLIKQSTKLSLETRIWPFLCSRFPAARRADSRWNDVSLYHLLTHTTGHESGFLFSSDIANVASDDLMDYIFSRPIPFVPGTHFSYSNVGTFLIAAYLQELLQKDYVSIADESLFQPLGIVSYKWRQYGCYCAASTGLELSLSDLHLLTEIILNNGKIAGEQLVDANWVKMMCLRHVATPKGHKAPRFLSKDAYGLNLWAAANQVAFCDGADGQCMVVDIEKCLAVTIMAHSGSQQEANEFVQELLG